MRKGIIALIIVGGLSVYTLPSEAGLLSAIKSAAGYMGRGAKTVGSGVWSGVKTVGKGMLYGAAMGAMGGGMYGMGCSWGQGCPFASMGGEGMMGGMGGMGGGYGGGM